LPYGLAIRPNANPPSNAALVAAIPSAVSHDKQVMDSDQEIVEALAGDADLLALAELIRAFAPALLEHRRFGAGPRQAVEEDVRVVRHRARESEMRVCLREGDIPLLALRVQKW
jgi:hypothetical protein